MASCEFGGVTGLTTAAAASYRTVSIVAEWYDIHLPWPLGPLFGLFGQLQVHGHASVHHSGFFKCHNAFGSHPTIGALQADLRGVPNFLDGQSPPQK